MGTYVTLPGGGGGGGGAENLDDLTDVDTVTDPPDDGDFLVYDTGTGKWAPATLTVPGSAVSVDASGFNGNLTTSDDTVQEVAQKLDDLVIPAAGIADPGGANDDFLQRKSGAWTNRTVAQVKADLGLPATTIPGISGWYEDNVYSGLQGLIHSEFGGGGQNATVGLDLLVLWRIMPVETVDVDGATFMISTSGTAGALARVGIYAASATTTEPTGAPLCDTGGVAVTDVSGTEVAATFTAVRLTAWTPYWGFMLSNNATFVPRLLAGPVNSQASARLDAGQITSSNHLIRRVSATYGTPPTDPTAPFTTSVSVAPGVLWRTQRI